MVQNVWVGKEKEEGPGKSGRSDIEIEKKGIEYEKQQNVRFEEKFDAEESTKVCKNSMKAKRKSKNEKEEGEENLRQAKMLKHCDICHKPFRYVSSLVSHKKSEHPDRTKFTCPECGEEVSRWALYEKHLRNHRESVKPNTVKCDICHKDFDYINSLLRHRQLLHPSVVPYKCTICSHVSPLYKDYKYHMQIDHKESGVKLSLSCLICEVCGKDFLCHYSLLSHRKFHRSPQYECKICQKRFKAKKSLQGHERLHTGEKPYSCDTCGKAFPGKSYLANHVTVHTGQKPHVCAVCGKAFSKKWNLVQHERIHTGERPYKCPICPQNFIQNFILKDHMKKIHNKDLKDFKSS